MDGVFGICATASYWPGFSAHAVDVERPFISQTGYRSFLGVHADPTPGLTPETFVAEVIAAHVRRELKGKLLRIEASYRQHAA